MNYSDGHRHIGGDSSHLPRPSRRLCLSCSKTWASDASVEALCLPFASYRPFASCSLTVRLVFPGDHPPAADECPPGPVRRRIPPAAAALGCRREAWSHGASGLWECRLPQALGPTSAHRAPGLGAARPILADASNVLFAVIASCEPGIDGC